MLIDFQQALADLVSSPQFCRDVRDNPSLLGERYRLNERERERLVALANHPAMRLNCMLYRANRLAPLAMNLGGFCKALGPRLGPLLTEYTALNPSTNVHFYRECDRFCSFLEAKLEDGLELNDEEREVFAKEALVVRLNLHATETAL
jgi:hypothetical protein